MSVFKWKATGITDTVTRLQSFKRRLRTKALRKAGNDASKVVLPVMKSATPVAKGAYSKGGSLRKSIGRKVQVRNDRMWFGVGPRTKWMQTVAKANRFWRDKLGRIRKAPVKDFKKPPTRGSWRPGGVRFEQPSRRAHLSEKRTQFISRTNAQTRGLAEDAMKRALQEAIAEA